MSKLRPYQKEGVKQIIRFNGRALLADEMRLGKTIQALWYLKLRPKIRPALVICPANAKWVWEEQAWEHIRMDSKVLEGCERERPRRYPPPDWPPLTIINYDIVQYWKQFLKKMSYKIVLLDECHYIKNIGKNKHRVKRTSACLSVAKKCPHIIGISGTPILSKPMELFNLLHLIDPEEWPSRVVYAWEFCNPRHNGWSWDYSGAYHTKRLNKRLRRTCMIRRRRKEVYKQLPDKIRSVVPLSIRHPQEYVHAENNFTEWLGDKSPKRLRKAENAIALAKLGYLKRLAVRLKIRAVRTWVRDFLDETEDVNEKLVLFGILKPAVKYLYGHFQNNAVNGTVSVAKRKAAVKTFQRNKRKRLYIGNILASGQAIELKPANTVAFFELDWVTGNHTQAEDRVVSVEDKEPPCIYYLVAKNTIEEDLCKILQVKSKVTGSVLDGDEDVENMNIYSQLMDRIRERRLL
jgi:SWI/SNF-related matrix-associated actin-dependent regulator 1 of chromatin subfamily A